MSHEQRREREKPTRTLFVRNVPYECSQQEITDIFSAYGKLARVYDLIQKRGMAFVTYVRVLALLSFNTSCLLHIS
jgi:RNA recognition motif-containing protein